MTQKQSKPIIFQGSLHKKNYFEGWYYKQVSSDQKTSLSFIPGISLSEHDPHSFIQYILVETHEDGRKETQTGYVRFPLESFTFQHNPFSVQIGQSEFTERFIDIDLVDDSMTFKGRLELDHLMPIQQSRLHPNIMGVFAYIPKMECYHGVISMNHSIQGDMLVGDRIEQFTGGKGYIEKDWGTSFPKHYIWLQSNHFNDATTSLFFSIAHIPFHFTEFEGFICNLVHQGKEYRFATYNLSRCDIVTITSNHVTLHLENRHARLDISAEVSHRANLIAPVKGTMQKTVKEGISGTLSIRLEDKKTGEIYAGKGLNAGVEIVDYEFETE
ncbi:tocopherol cyclase family protein [Ruoffia tabacinasalis]|uniref:tocopherol cyclase family protein n=1 Tax=Ruoffia tabacinasalis TaxID=87458 RepID=UPI0030CEA2E3